MRVERRGPMKAGTNRSPVVLQVFGLLAFGGFGMAVLIHAVGRLLAGNDALVGAAAVALLGAGILLIAMAGLGGLSIRGEGQQVPSLVGRAHRHSVLGRLMLRVATGCLVGWMALALGPAVLTASYPETIRWRSVVITGLVIAAILGIHFFALRPLQRRMAAEAEDAVRRSEAMDSIDAVSAPARAAMSAVFARDGAALSLAAQQFAAQIDRLKPTDELFRLGVDLLQQARQAGQAFESGDQDRIDRGMLGVMTSYAAWSACADGRFLTAAASGATNASPPGTVSVSLGQRLRFAMLTVMGAVTSACLGAGLLRVAYVCWESGEMGGRRSDLSAANDPFLFHFMLGFAALMGAALVAFAPYMVSRIWATPAQQEAFAVLAPKIYSPTRPSLIVMFTVLVLFILFALIFR